MTYEKAVKEKLPINRINISGTEILNIDLNQGWEITDIKFDNTCPSAYIDELVVTFSKSREKKNEEMKYPFDEYICGVTGLTCCGCSLFCEHRKEKKSNG